VSYVWCHPWSIYLGGVFSRGVSCVGIHSQVGLLLRFFLPLRASTVLAAGPLEIATCAVVVVFSLGTGSELGSRGWSPRVRGEWSVGFMGIRMEWDLMGGLCLLTCFGVVVPVNRAGCASPLSLGWL